MQILLESKRRSLQELQSRRTRGRPPLDLVNQIRLEEQQVEQIQNGCNEASRLNENHSSDFFISRINLKLNTFDSLINEFIINQELEQENNMSFEFSDQPDPIENLYFETFNTNFQDNIRFSNDFETKQKDLIVNHCIYCEQISLDRLKDNICNKCRKYRNLAPHQLNNIQSELNPFSIYNDMLPGDQPEVLKDLTLIEQILISPIKPFITIFRLRGGQYGYNGNVINFAHDISNLTTDLPHAMNSLSEFVVVRKENEDLSRFRDFKVRKKKF